MHDGSLLARFEQAILPHLDAAHNLARWLTRSDQDAEDVVQEACLRAFRFFGNFRGGDGRTWLLAIVRNTAYTWIKKNRAPGQVTSFDEDQHAPVSTDGDPEALLQRNEDADMLRAALDTLPTEYREVVVLRELEELSYKEIAQIAGIPVGTVMSRLARGRERLQQVLIERQKKDR